MECYNFVSEKVLTAVRLWIYIVPDMGIEERMELGGQSERWGAKVRTSLGVVHQVGAEGWGNGFYI